MAFLKSTIIDGTLYVSESISASLGFVGQLFGNADTSTSASYALSASYAPNMGGGTSLETGSTYPFTASWAESSSYSTIASRSYTTDNISFPGTATIIGIATGTAGITSGDNVGANQIGFFTGNGCPHVLNAVQIGTSVAVSTQTSSYAVQVGWDNGGLGDSTNAVIIGRQCGKAGRLNVSSVLVGFVAGQNAVSASSAVIIGANAGQNATNATNAVMVGRTAGRFAVTGSNSVFLGNQADTAHSGLDVQKSIAIGYNAKVSGSLKAVIGGTGADAVQVGIGTDYPTNTLHVVGDITANVVTASLNGTSSYALQALSASWAPNSVHVEKGIISGSLFVGDPKSYDITFTSAFVNDIYIVSVVGDSARAWSTSNRTATGFTIDSNSNQLITGMVMYKVEEI